MIEQRYWERAYEKGRDKNVVKVVRGLRYTVAEMDDGSAGLAFSFPWNVSPLEKACRVLSRLSLDSWEVMDLRHSGCLCDRVVAVAVANSILGKGGISSGDIPEISEGTSILMVGYIHPMLKILQRRGLKPAVLDDHYPGSIPLGTGLSYASSCDLVILSASTVANGTWERFLSRAHNVWIVGPSAPMDPELFENTPVRVVMGRKIIDLSALCSCLHHGGGTRDLSTYTRKMLLQL